MDIPIRGCKSVLTDWLGQGYKGNQDRYSRTVWRRLVDQDLYLGIQCRWWNIHVVQQWPGTWHLLSSHSKTCTMLSGPHIKQTPSINWTPAWLAKLFSKIHCKKTLHSTDNFVKLAQAPVISHFLAQKRMLRGHFTSKSLAQTPVDTKLTVDSLNICYEQS